MHRHLMSFLLTVLLLPQMIFAAEPIRVGCFDVDASPPVGSPLAYDPAKGVQTPLSCRGVVLAGAGKPVVLCAVDWIGISNGGQTVFRESLASAAGTEPQRVAVHTLHQHDAPRCDFAADDLLSQYGLEGVGFDPAYARDVIDRAAAAVKVALAGAKPVTHLGIGSGVVEKVASNRRILGPDGKVMHTRWTATTDPKIRAFPVGTIDPELKLISFFSGDEPIAALTYYATHPQSYYRTGLANPDFPGLARNARQKETGVPHIHFNGAGGDIGAGKFNDGSKENRQVLADRVAAGMKHAWENMEKSPLSAEDVGWSVEPVVLPVSEQMDEAALTKTLEDENANAQDRWYAAKNLIWLGRCQSGDTIDISCLTLKTARVLHMPGELLIEYQLAAQKHRPDLFVAMAAYGEYAPGYIATEIAYSQGGYEASPGASKVAPTVEGVLMGAIRKLLGSE
ncbi:MAG: hypothetical protein ABIP48_00745 [Planctomycetota bacterium]